MLSMTGYGRDKQVINGQEIIVEYRSVNSRYFELNIKTPNSLRYIDEKLRQLTAGQVSRGKLEISLSVSSVNSPETSAIPNVALITDYINALRKINCELNLKDDITLSTVMRIPDAFITSKEDDEEKAWEEIKQVAETALKNFIESRTAEGSRLAIDILQKIQNLENISKEIEKLATVTVVKYREKLFAKLSEILQDRNIDEQRLLLEAGLFAEKTSVDEELTRLKSHFALAREIVENKGAVGKRFDFLVQELNREINTTGSKCQDAEIAKLVIDAKSEIEKIREQIQNIE